jgi:hypothetical protein
MRRNWSMRGSLEVAHDDAALAQRGGQRGGVALRMAGEDEVGGRRQHLEAERGQVWHQGVAAGDDLPGGCSKYASSSIAALAPAIARRSSG